MKITWRTEWPQWLLIAAQFAVAGLTSMRVSAAGTTVT